MEWISVKDKLPDSGDQVLVSVLRKRSPNRTFIGLFVSDPERFYVMGRYEKDVEYWMPLPEPPEK